MKLRSRRIGAILGAESHHAECDDEEILSVVADKVEVPEGTGQLAPAKQNLNG